MNNNGTALRGQKEKRLRQYGKVIWMTGLSGAGKTTLAIHLEKELNARGYLTRIIDNDRVRSGLNRDLGFSEDDRHENLRRIAEVAKLFCETGVIVIATFISPTEFSREQARGIIGSDDFMLLYVNASIEVCEKRDVKGLYKKARIGLIPFFTGIDSPFDPPENADIEVETDRISVEEAIDKILSKIIPCVEYRK
ncbi:MAG: adenylyl-sulfate kinase [Bacteroidales bacterium]|nr:adenylyl-sulfate kinase [Bacteroidales bacterium]MBN2762610.1 adenylyl-sulfate kinase [Bacteroidales bacterium]